MKLLESMEKKIIINVLLLISIIFVYFLLIIIVPIIAKNSNEMMKYDKNIYYYNNELDIESLSEIDEYGIWNVFTIYDVNNNDLYNKLDNLSINVYVIINSIEQIEIPLSDNRIDGFLLREYNDSALIDDTINILSQNNNYDIYIEYSETIIYSNIVLENISAFIVESEQLETVFAKNYKVQINGKYDIDDYENSSELYRNIFADLNRISKSLGYVVKR